MSTVIESGMQLLARLTVKTKKPFETLEDRLFPKGLHRKQIVEITGDPGSGKTILLTQLIAICILPTEYGGSNVNVLLIDADHHFQVSKLAQIMRHTVQNASTEFKTPDESKNESKLEEIIDVSLKNLLVINCTNYYQFECNLYSLPDMLSSNDKIGIVAFDGISAFYWQDRELSDKNPMSISTYVSGVLKKIKESTLQFNVKIIFTNHSAYEPSKDRSYSESQSQLETTLGKVNYKIHLSKEIYSTQGMCKVDSTTDSRSFKFEMTEVGLKWLEASNN